jgi:tRNA(Ile)-lysidine synthase
MVAQDSNTGAILIDAAAFATLPDEIALRLLGRAIARVATEGPVELGKLEALLTLLQAALAADRPRWTRTLAGATVTASPHAVRAGKAIVVAAAPPRRPTNHTR